MRRLEPLLIAGDNGGGKVRPRHAQGQGVGRMDGGAHFG